MFFFGKICDDINRNALSNEEIDKSGERGVGQEYRQRHQRQTGIDKDIRDRQI